MILCLEYLVLNELDDLKKRSENARNVIRWLEQEFKHGNRHLRAQRDNENLTLSLLKIPRKLGKCKNHLLIGISLSFRNLTIQMCFRP